MIDSEIIMRNPQLAAVYAASITNREFQLLSDEAKAILIFRTVA